MRAVTLAWGAPDIRHLASTSRSVAVACDRSRANAGDVFTALRTMVRPLAARRPPGCSAGHLMLPFAAAPVPALRIGPRAEVEERRLGLPL